MMVALVAVVSLYEVCQEGLWLAVRTILPVLAAGVLSGLLTAVVQSWLQWQEATVAWAVRWGAQVLVLVWMGPELAGQFAAWCEALFWHLPGWSLP